MTKNRIILITVLITFLPCVSPATVPPKAGISVSPRLRARMEIIRSEYTQGYWAKRMAQRRAERERLSIQGPEVPLAVDSVYVPMLLGRYADATEALAPDAFQAILFDGPNPSGTVTQYYFDNSYGQLYFSGKAEGWYTAPRSSSYYVHDGGDRNAGLVYGGRDFTIDLLAAADPAIDFSKYVEYYDAQGRGVVPQLGIIHTGADAASGADNIWSHRWNIRTRLLERKQAGSDPYFDVSRVTEEGYYITDDMTSTGKPIIIRGDYAIHPELEGSSNEGSAIKKIGVFVHEFGHIFGLPDLYDTDGSSEGLGNWCVMAGGSYGGDGGHEAYPANMSAWCKIRLGWATPVNVTSYAKAQQIRHSEVYPEFFKLWKLGNGSGKEYFLVENRQKVMSDRYLINSGLAIYHIDETQGGNYNENRYLVDLEQADNLRDLNRGVNRGDLGDVFPGSTNNRAFDGSSKPNSNDYNSAATYAGVRNISSSALTMTADLDVGTRAYVLVRNVNLVESAVSDHDGRVTPGESGNLKIRYENAYPTAGSGMEMRVQSTTPGLIADTTVTFSLGSLQLDSLTIVNFLTVPPTFTPREATFQVTIALPPDELAYSGMSVVGYPAVLFVDGDSTAENIERFYRKAVDIYGAGHETYKLTSGSIAAAAPEKRSVIVLFTGRKKNETIPDSVQDQLRAHVNAGKHLFVTGQNIAEDLHARGSAFLTEVLKAAWSKNITLGRNLFGIPGDQFGGQFQKLVISGAPAAANQTSPDELKADSLVGRSWLYNSATGSSYAAVWHQDAVSGARVMFFGFGFEAINDSSSTATQAQVMASILGWFDGVTDVPEPTPVATVPSTFALDQNYPNPFNPATTISVQLPVASSVRLVVYNLMGQEIATIIDGQRAAGKHRFSFDGSRLSSGVYFYSLEASPAAGKGGTFRSVKKMMLLK